jgi:hypothetical protein
VTHNYSKVPPVINHENKNPHLEAIPEAVQSTKYSGISFAKPSMKNSLMYGFGGSSS